MTINRVSNGESNVDHYPGGESLHLEKDKWYKVKVDLGEGNKVSAFVDGKKVFEQMASAPTGHYTAAGYDESAGETVIKVVNSTNEPYDATIVMNASKVLPEGKAITLSASDKKAENSMENPEMTVHRPWVCGIGRPELRSRTGAWGVASYIFDFCGGGNNSKSDGVTTEMTIFTEKENMEDITATVKGWDFVDPERVALLGCSQGGLVASLTAAANPGDYKSLVLVFHDGLFVALQHNRP